MDNYNVSNTINNKGETTTAITVNHAREFYKNVFKNAEAYANFFNEENYRHQSIALVENDNMMKALEKQLEELRTARITLMESVYADEITLINKNYVLAYTNRSRVKCYYNYPSGEAISSPDDDMIEIPLNLKNGEIEIPYGYAFNYGALIIRLYTYKVSADNSKVILTLVDEGLQGLLEVANKSLHRGSFFIKRTCLEKINANEFLNSMFGIERDFGGLTLWDVRKGFSNNSNAETIIKLAPISIVKELLDVDMVNKAPIWSIMGLTKTFYNMANKANLLLEAYKINSYISSKRFNMSEEDWMEILKKSLAWEEDLDFYGIKYWLSDWKDEERRVSGILLRNLARFYSDNNEICSRYSFGKFSHYVVSATVDQGYKSVFSFMEELKDYIKMCINIGKQPLLYSDRVRTQHDMTSRNNAVFVEQHQEEIFHNRYTDYKNEAIKNTNYSVFLPENTEAIKNEGDNLGHCVASYIKRIIDGTTLIFFLRKKKEESNLTVEIRDGAIVQARGMYNRTANDDEAEALRLYAEKHHLNLQYAR